MPIEAGFLLFDVINSPLRIKVSMSLSPKGSMSFGKRLCPSGAWRRHGALADGVKHLAHEIAGDVARDEDDTRFTGTVRPGGQFERGMKQALHRLHDDRPFATRYVENAFHA